MANSDDLIIFLGSGRLFVSDGNRILPFELPPTAVRDWDLLNKVVLQDNLNSFITTNKIEPSPLTFVLSESACFSKDLVVKDPTKTDAESVAFLDAVPFNYVVSKTYKIGQGVRAIASNKDLIDAIAEVFEGKGFPLFAVVPAAIFPQVGTKNELDMQFVKAILDSHEIIQSGNMIAPKPLAPELAVSMPVITNTKASSGYLPFLIGIGVVALIVLGVLLFLRH